MYALEKSHRLRVLDSFFYSPAYFFLCAALTVIANVCGAELFAYSCFTLIVVYLCLFGRDLLPILPLMVCAYIAPSRSNNPGLSSDSLFSMANGGVYLIVLAVILIVAVAYRLIRDRELGRMAFLRGKRVLLPGLGALAIAYLLSGIGSAKLAEVGTSNLLFSFIQAAAIFVPYFLLSGLVKWEKAPRDYLAWSGICIGYILAFELLFLYLRYDVVQNGIIDREIIYSGWGHYNNIGAMLAMMIPFPFMLAAKGEHSILSYFSGLIFFIALIFTASRSAIFCGVVAFVASYGICVLRRHQTKADIAMHIATGVVSLAVIFLFFDELLHLFEIMLSFKFDLRMRDVGWKAGWKQFLGNPIFGGTFFPNEYDLFTWATSENFVSFFPPRWHNTIIQILASCGAVGIIAYGFHRFQTLRLFLRKTSREKLLVLMAMLALLATSLVDCHFFNVGPVLFYSGLLAFAENQMTE